MATVEKMPMLQEGYETLTADLRRLKTERPLVVDAIEEARAHGDLSENAEYHAAREQQGFIEGRIQELESKLSTAEVIDVTQLPATGKVVFGATVDLEDEDTGAKVTYQIVGEDEADIKAGRLVRLFSTEVPVNFAYYVVAPKAKLNLPKVSFFRDWLQAQVTELDGFTPAFAGSLSEVAA